MSVKWTRGPSKRRKKVLPKRVREMPRAPKSTAPKIKDYFKGPRQPGVPTPSVGRPFIHADHCGCGIHKEADYLAGSDNSASVLSDLVSRGRMAEFEVSKITWHYSGSERTCTAIAAGDLRPICSTLQGHTWPSFDAFVSAADGRGGQIGLVREKGLIFRASHPNCSCRISARFDNKDTGGFLEFWISAGDKAASFKESSSPDLKEFPRNDEEESRVRFLMEQSKSDPNVAVMLRPDLSPISKSEYDRVERAMKTMKSTGSSLDDILDYFEKTDGERCRTINEGKLRSGIPLSPEDEFIPHVLWLQRIFILNGWEGQFRERSGRVSEIPEIPSAAPVPEPEAPEEPQPLALGREAPAPGQVTPPAPGMPTEEAK